jgi:threonine synthase
LRAQLICTTCGAELPLHHLGRCCFCQGRLEVAGQTWPERLNHAAAAPVARFEALLPFGLLECTPGQIESATPMVASRLGHLIRGTRLELKLETANPAGSSVNRGVLACVARARALGFKRILVADIGLASAAAVCASRMGLACTALLPAASPAAAVLETACRGARIIRVEAPAHELAEAARSGSFNAGAYLVERSDPFWIEGMKTIADEILKDCAPEPPDCIVLPNFWQLEARAVEKGFQEWRPTASGDGVPEAVAPELAQLALGAPTGDQAPARQPITRRDALAAQRLLAEEDGLVLGQVAATTVAAAIKLARVGMLGARRRIVAIVDNPADDLPAPAHAPRGKICTLDELPGALSILI